MTLQTFANGELGLSVRTKINDNFVLLDGRTYPSAKDFGAVGDGVADDTAALQAALNSGVTFLPPGTYRTTSNLLPPSNSGFIGAGPQSVIRLVGATTQSVIRGNGVSGVYIDNLTLDGDKATKPSASHCLRMDNCTGWTVPRLWAKDGRSWAVGCYTSSDNKFGTIYSEGAQSSSGLFFQSGSNNNEVTALYAKNCGGFGLQIFGSSGNRVGIVYAEDCGLEAVGINYFSDRNQVGEVYSIRSGDNGVSITGTGNQIGTIYADTPDFHGLAFYGNYNVVGTLISRNAGQAGPNFAAVAFIPGFGGQANHNIVGAVIAIDDQTPATTVNVARAVGDSHTNWAPTTFVGPNAFRRNAGGIYWSALGGTTGTTAPTHTSGTVSDGGVLWQYLQPTSTALNNVVYSARWTPNISALVFGQAGNQFNLSWLQTNTELRFNGEQPINRTATQWFAGVAVRWGRYFANNGNTYICSNVGGTTANAPTHTAGTVTGADGIAWTFVRNDGLIPIVRPTSDAGVLTQTRWSFPSASDPNNQRCDIMCGTSSPETVVRADPGSIFLRTDASPGIECFVKTENTDETGWRPFMVRRFGTTANRPALSGGGFTGVMYFDTTLGRPIWFNGTAWVDATGATV